VKIAVVIPALDEAGFVEQAVSSALEGPLEVEVVVVDGGSRDETITRAEAAGARVLRGDRGRGEQQDVGWRATQADAVLFLHADTRLPAGWSQCVADVMSDPEVAGGAFRFRFDEQGVIWRLMELGVAVRVLVLGLPYGDQGLFLRRSILERSGGVPHVALMEDLDLVRMIKRSGRLALLSEAVTTSSRRYRVGGLPRTVAAHFVALLSWYLGVDRARVARWVRG
jgi:rSAM/selenodomain-associated transferase 2